MKRGFLLSKNVKSDQSSPSSRGGGEEGLALANDNDDITKHTSTTNKRMILKQNDTVMDSCQQQQQQPDEENTSHKKMDDAKGCTRKKGRGVSALDSWIDNVRNGVVGDGSNWDHCCSSSNNDTDNTMLDYNYNKADNVVADTTDLDGDDEMRDDDDDDDDDNANNSVSNITNASTIIKDGTNNNKYFGRPLLPSIAETPRQDLQRFYPSVNLTDKCYFTWEIGDMSTTTTTSSFPNQQLNKLYTGVFVCPVTYEYFFSGRYQEIDKSKKTKSSNIIQYFDRDGHDDGNDNGYDGSYDDSSSFPSTSCCYVWYKRKKWAEHGAAAVATSCFQFRKQVKQIIIDSHRKYHTNNDCSAADNNNDDTTTTSNSSRAIEETIHEYITRETKKLPRLGLDLPYLAACDKTNDNDDVGNSSSYYYKYIKKVDAKLFGDPNYDKRMGHIPKNVQQQIQQQIQQWKEDAQRQSQQLMLEQQANDELQFGREGYISLRKDQI